MDDKNFKKRMLYSKTAIVFFMLLLISRLIYVQVIKGETYRKKSEENMIKSIPISPFRGAIMDCNGEIIAQNNPQYKIAMLSYELRNPPSAVSSVAMKLNLKPSEVKEILKKVQMNPSEPIVIKENIDYVSLSKLAEIKGDYPGIYFETESRRNYPLKEFASHVIGYLGEINLEELEELSHFGYQIGDSIGKDGLEKQYDNNLRGANGARQVLVNVEGKIIRFVGKVPPANGEMLFLNIDKQIQQTAEKELKNAVMKVTRKNGEPVGGAVVVIKAATGEILGIASYPNFDPNLFSRGISSKDYLKLAEDPESPMLNRAVHCPFPCASTYKMITSATALQEKLVKRDTLFHCGGAYNVGGMVFNCFVRSGHGDINFINSIAHSCDVVFYQLANRFEIQRFLKYSKEFGIGDLTNIDIPGESKGLLPDPEWKEKVYKEKWYVGDTINLSIGQGYVGVTPIQLAVATAAVANGGKLYKPHLVKRIVSSEGRVVKEFTPELIRKISVDEKNLEVIKEGMRCAVKYGTAVSANSPVVEISGKTGTAENFPTKENPQGRNHTWFTCFAPYTNPEIIVTVFIEKSGGFGGEWCAPVARRIIETYFTRHQAK